MTQVNGHGRGTALVGGLPRVMKPSHKAKPSGLSALPKGISVKGLKLNQRKARARQSNYVVIPTSDSVTRDTILKIVKRISGIAEGKHWNLSEERISSLVDALLPSDQFGNAINELEVANAKLRAEFVAENGCYTATQLSSMFKSSAADRVDLTSEWKAKGRIFSISFQHSERYPAFQFREGLPHPTIAAVLAALPQNMTGWQRAFWFVTPNGWLGGARPADRLGDEAAVVAAAIQESSPIG